MAIDPEASGPSDIKTETTTSFQEFAPAVKDHTGVDLDSTLYLNSSALQLNVDSTSRGPHPPGLPRTAGAYSADPPSQEASGMKRYSSTDIPKASSSIMGSSQNSELNFGQYSGQPEGNQTIAHAYSLVHDNSQFGVANTSSLETTISPRTNQDIAYPIPASYGIPPCALSASSLCDLGPTSHITVRLAFIICHYELKNGCNV